VRVVVETLETKTSNIWGKCWWA